MLEELSSLNYVYFQKILGSNMGSLNLLLSPGAIHLTWVHPWMGQCSANLYIFADAVAASFLSKTVVFKGGEIVPQGAILWFIRFRGRFQFPGGRLRQVRIYWNSAWLKFGTLGLSDRNSTKWLNRIQNPTQTYSVLRNPTPPKNFRLRNPGWSHLFLE